MFVLSLQFHILFKRCKDLLSAPFLIPSPGSSSCVSVLSLSLSVPLSLHPSLSSSPRHTPNPRLSPRSHLTASHSRAPHSQQQAFGEVAGCWGGRLPTHPPHPKNRGMQVAAPPHQHSSSLWVSAPPSTPATNGFQTRHYSGIRYGIFRFPQSYKPS